MQVYSVDVLVIGAGVVGLAVARALAREGREVWIAEAGSETGGGISSRNSEVVHAGIYYPAGSLKARLCVQGKQQLYEYCDQFAVPHQRCGKLIVATQESQMNALKDILQRGLANGVDDLQWLGAHALHEREPDVRGVAAVWSPSTGIVDSHALMQRLLQQALDAGAHLLLNTPVHGGNIGDHGLDIILGGREPCRVEPTLVVNSAGLQAVSILQRVRGFPADAIPEFHLAKGNYYAFNGKTPFRHLIYPIPEDGGLGIHLTLDLAGQARFGPDVEWTDVEDYQVNTARHGEFVDAIRSYWPSVSADRLQADYAGIRPKLSRPGQPPADFLIQGPRQHGVPGVVNLLGIESPGLTSCLAIADYVRSMVASEEYTG